MNRNRSFFYKRRAAAAKKDAAATATAAAATAATTAPAAAPADTYMTAEYKRSILEGSVLGVRGFTIPKSILNKDDYIDLIRELSVKPIAAAGSPAAAAAAPANQVLYMYRENDKKIYIPRYYAENRYGGYAINTKIPAGDNMETHFKGTIRENQQSIIDTYLSHVNSRGATVGGGGLLSVPCGYGKTVIAIKLATELRRKTLIIVHKEFLMNQWIERIHDFCVGARVGKIQGDVFDIENKDFVICMLQTLYQRPFAEDAFHSFGFLVVDETHRICSEQFSKALFKMNPIYTLGISATIQRKDGLESILNMFIGNVLCHIERQHDDLVAVRAIEYNSADGDEDFQKVEYDYRGSVKYSTMICKLCEYSPRTEFIIGVIRDLLEENAEQQIMVIAHNKSVLHNIYDAIHDRKIATVGYYVGGMKEKDLKNTEEKTIVIATYSMAAEALDIKTLSTLVMVTPKTDIIQTVGRILRMKHNQPIVVDIVDTHDVFKNQWRQRRAFYKKCNYRIRYIKSADYKNMKIDWETDRTWRRMHEPIAAPTAPPCDPCSDNEGEAPATSAAPPKKCMINISALKPIGD